MSVAAGILVAFIWYGGHLVSLLALPVLAMAIVAIPKDERMRPLAENGGARTKIPGGVYYFTLLIFVFMVMYNVAGMNISTHIVRRGDRKLCHGGHRNGVDDGGRRHRGAVFSESLSGFARHDFSFFIRSAFCRIFAHESFPVVACRYACRDGDMRGGAQPLYAALHLQCLEPYRPDKFGHGDNADNLHRARQAAASCRQSS